MHIGIVGPISINSLYDYLYPDQNYDRNIGLGGTAVNTIIIGLLKAGHRVSVYTLSRDVFSPIVMNGPNLTIHIGEYRNRGRVRMKDLFRGEVNTLHKFITEDKPDILHAHWTYEFALAAIKSRVPHLITIRDDALRILWFRKDLYGIIRFLLNAEVMIKGKNFNVNSLYLKEELKMFKGDYDVIHNPILEEFITGQGKTLSDKIKVVSVLNGWGERKNPKPALKAFKLLFDEFGDKVEYTIYGPDYGANEICHQWAGKNNLNAHVIFKGAVSHGQLMTELSDYHILLHPAKEESFGNMLLEGMAKGLPVIGGQSSGAVPEVLNFGNNGILTDINSPKEIYKSLKNLIGNRPLFEKLSKEGIRYVRENYSSLSIAEKYVDKFKKILIDK